MNAKEYTIHSPNQIIAFHFAVEDAKPCYWITYNSRPVIENSTLGLAFKDKSYFGSPVQLLSFKADYFNNYWHAPVGTDSLIKDEYNQGTFTLNEPGLKGKEIAIEVRVYDDGVGFRYRFPGNESNSGYEIVAEQTEFNVSPNDSVWWIDADAFAYEGLYHHTKTDAAIFATTPITFEKADGLVYCIHEAELRDYPEMNLINSVTAPGHFISQLRMDPDSICAHVSVPSKSPWRVVIIGKDAGVIATSHLVQNLCAPSVIKDVSWIKPLKFNGIWWGMHTGYYTWEASTRHGATTERTKNYLDFAHEHHLGGTLVEGWNEGWETWKPNKAPKQNYLKAYPDFNLPELAEYANIHNVELVGHHETGGNIPDYEHQVDTAFALYEQLGIHYVKTGYAGTILPLGYPHHGQYLVRHFENIVKKAAEHHIMLDVHESIKPTGLDRTFPNLLTQEAGRGNEWNATFNYIPPYQHTVLPFARMVAGPFDYTPGIFKLNHSPEKDKRVPGTLARELAYYVVLYSPMTMVADMIENYKGNPAFSFLERAPASWDETKVLKAKIGSIAIFARRKGSEWYLGGVTNQHARLESLPLSFLKPNKKYTLTQYSDSKTTNYYENPEAIAIQKFRVSNKDTISIAMAGAGGFAAIIEEEKTNSKYPNVVAFNKQSRQLYATFKQQKEFGDYSVASSAKGSKITLENTYHKSYPASGDGALVDGKVGDIHSGFENWQGFYGCDIDAIIDYGQPTDIQEISCKFLFDPSNWIYAPDIVTYWGSEDGVTFEKLYMQFIDNKKLLGDVEKKCEDVHVKLASARLRYLKMTAHNWGNCPNGFPGAGQESWIFTDEIITH